METTFWKISDEYEIEIPIIQRDYAQGRKSEEKIAKKLIEDIYNALSTKKPLSLDFIYGKTENNKSENNKLIPLDGQQRLTTLWLLHWYLALKENKLSDNNVKNTLEKFSYEVRLTSKDFCGELIEKGITYNSEVEKISDEIKNQNWFYLSWEYDPTVVNMLNMLDIIHDKFKNTSNIFYDLLIGDKCPIIFYFLPMEEFSLTDELYIKMNARGKPLTPFENFKARFSELLRDDHKHKLDTDWLDIFWDITKQEGKENEPNPDKAEEKFYNFFSNIALLFYVETSDIDKNFIDTYDLQNVLDEDLKGNNKTVFIDDNVNRIIKVLDNIKHCEKNEIIWNYFIDFLKPHNKIDYWERVRFYSLLMLIDKEVTDNIKQQKWFRVTKNLINNTLIDSPEDFSKAIRSLKNLSERISDIYNYLQKSNQKSDFKIEFFYKEQVEEEKIKAKLICSNDRDWEEQIIMTEKFRYFDGQIGFLLEMSKNNGKYDKTKFKQYSDLMKFIFENYKNNNEFLFERALLAKGNYLVQKGSNYTFCNYVDNLRTKMENWRKVFNDREKRGILKNLLDEILVKLGSNNDNQNLKEENIKDVFQKIIDDYNVRDWRYLFIKNKELLEFCKERQIRFWDENKIYLLSSIRITAKYAELYTYDLFKYLHKYLFDNKINEIEYKKEEYKKEKENDYKFYISFNNDKIKIYYDAEQNKFQIYYQNGQKEFLNTDIFNKDKIINQIIQKIK